MIYDNNFNVLDESKIDLSIGRIMFAYKIKEDAAPVDNITKFIYTPDDYEEVKVYIEDEHMKERKELAAKPSQLDIIEAQVTYTAMMTDTLLED